MNDTFTLPDMTCGHCEARVTRALQALEGVESVTIELSRQQAEVGWDESRTTRDRIREVLTKAGYPPR
ncbi:MAG: heavy-metal-associated domain-containing protein [Armatimonadetes bacterium]|nr:heavy-metal-associated domain-containing protein [Armatimonadota bacterium]